MAATGSYTDFEAAHEDGLKGEAMGHLHEGLIEKSWWEALSPYVAELCGTFLLTLTYLCNSSAGDSVWAVTSNGVMVMVAMYCFGHVSGGKLNPCISIALWLARRHTLRMAVQFCAAQVTGGICAALLFYRFAHIEVDLGPKPGFSAWEVVVVECLYTAMICFVYLNCAASRGNNPMGDPNGFVGLAVGLCYISGGYASMEISGTVMNPAVAIGVQIADLRDALHTNWGLKYLPMELFGAFMAVSAYRLVRPKELDTASICDPHDPHWEAPTGAKVMAEFLGTFFVVFTKALNNIGHSKAEAWSVAATLAAMQYALRGVSGGHFNPAVSLSAALCSRRLCTARNALIYVGAQVLAGLAASAMYSFVHHGAQIAIRPPQEFQHRLGAIVVGEVVFTCLCSYVVLATSAVAPVVAKTRQNNIAGLAVGMCIAVGGFAVGNISGAILNPAMAVGFTGLNFIGGDMFQSLVAAYIAYEVAGALLASCIFFLTHARLYRPDGGDPCSLGAGSFATPAGSCD
mmetsp:Transcript_25313/g.79854  ORF Transcript_25313/g.79854 Transcript_25313/m.79854 type:complete len:516 (-) Transcript_25313:63-1610(-)